MKILQSVIKDKKTKDKLFQYSVSKAKQFLRDVFGIEVEKNDPKILRIHEDILNQQFCVTFLVNERQITLSLVYENDDINSSILTELLLITENDSKEIKIIERDDSIKIDKAFFKGMISKVKSLLEQAYNLDFTPICLNEPDKNIKEVTEDDEKFTWCVRFTHGDHEGFFISSYKCLPGTYNILDVTHFKQHKIYLT